MGSLSLGSTSWHKSTVTTVEPEHSGQGEVGAVGGQVDERDFEDLVAGGAFGEREGEQEKIEEGQVVEGPDDTAGQEGRLDTILPTLARKNVVQGDPTLNWQRKEEDADAVPFDCRGEVVSQSDLLS